MKLIERFWTAVSTLGSILTLSPYHETGLQQTPLGGRVGKHEASIFKVPWPRFYPPTGPPDGFPGDDFYCDYPGMMGWESCAHETNQCWLRNPKTGEQYNITTNYENYAPKGVTRKYTLDIRDGHWDADGINFPYAKLVNGTYPGPWLQGCWGDTMEVTFLNNLRYNGTSIHWHGVRMNYTMNMDGVNGVSQCPTAPGDSYTYKYKVVQYGSSWYHSHYGVQYADGVLGPITFHGPTSENFDVAKKPICMTEWFHNSIFNAVTTMYGDRQSFLLNGRGDARRFGYKNETAVAPMYNITFDRREPYKPPKRYLLLIFNTASETTFVFSIDNHYLQVVSMDFVPIHSYAATSVLVGIGQRYHIIVTAEPVGYGDNEVPADGNYWIRMHVARCFRQEGGGLPDGHEKAAILRYDPTSKANPTTNSWGNIALGCVDEPPSRLRPILEWKVGPAANWQPDKYGKPSKYGEEFDVVGMHKPKEELPYPLAYYSLGNWSDWNPMQVNYSHPIFFDFDKPDKVWPKEWSVIPEDFGPEDWVYLVIDGTSGHSSFGAHPFHLHGHDFALLQTEDKQPWSPEVFKPNYNNPPRRDVVLLPAQGFIVVAFKADNPGAWLLHCHIAAHASEGLGFQILERQKDASKLWPPNSPEQIAARKHCDTWNKWAGNSKNWFHSDLFIDDSGI